LQYAQKAENPPFWQRFFRSGPSPPRKIFFLPCKDFFLPCKIFSLPRSSFPFLFSISNFSVIADSFQNADFRTADFFSQATDPFSSVFQAHIPEALSRLQILAAPPCGGNSFFFQTVTPLRPFSKLASADSRKASITELQRRSCFKRKSAPRKHAEDALCYENQVNL
jgi:hypothetical protein